MKQLYGEFPPNQIAAQKKALRGSIFFLLLCVDPQTCANYQNVDVDKTFTNLLLKMSGLNELLMNQQKLVSAMSWLQAAKSEYEKPDFDFKVYRNEILTAGAEIQKLEEV